MSLFFIPAFLMIHSLVSPCSAGPLSGLSMPASCSGQTYCFDKHDDYPTDVVNSLLNATNHLFVNVPSEIEHRSEDDENECAHERHMRPMYEIIDTNRVMRFVVQSPELFEQIIRIEKCTTPGEVTESRNIARLTLNNYKVTCEQCTMDYQFLVLSLDGTRLETAKMKDGVPVCCWCRKARK